MFRIGLMSTALGTALLLGAPAAMAQRSTMDEMNRERANPAVPATPLQNRNAADADQMGFDSPSKWLQQASDALRRNRNGQAMELLERAETRLLSRSTPAGMADQPAQGPMVSHISAARQALANRDRAGAQQQIDQAMAMAGRMDGGMTSGADAGHYGMQGGGGYPHSMSSYPQPMPMGGAASSYDSGMGTRSMARADLILAQNSTGVGPESGARSGAARPAVPGAGPAVQPPARGAPPPGSGGIPAGRTGSEMNPDDAARRMGPSGTGRGASGTAGGGASGGGGGSN